MDSSPDRLRLLIVTQKVDAGDPILGFFIRWLSAFSQECAQVHVIAQARGLADLPANVSVSSLGKEEGKGRWRQVRTFWTLLRSLKRETDVVFVHMTPVWVVLGFPIWFLQRKPVYLWYEARGGGWWLPLSVRLVRAVFSATSYGVSFSTRKQLVVGHGIDTDQFRLPSGPRDPRLVVTVGRLTATKHLPEILRAFAALPPQMRLVIAGGTITLQDEAVEEEIVSLAEHLKISARLEMGFRTHGEIVSLFQSAKLMLHACGGGLDKVVLEAMACGCPVVSCSVAAKQVLPRALHAEPDTLGEIAKRILAMSDEDYAFLGRECRSIVMEKHSLPKLINRLVKEMS